MAPARHTTRAPQKAAASRKTALRLGTSTSSSSRADTSSLANQVRALERAREDLVHESAEQQRRIADLEAALADRERTHAHDCDRLLRRASIFLGDNLRALEQKMAVEARLAAAEADRAAWEAERAELVRDRLESKIHWCAAKVVCQMYGSPEEQRELARILDRCRRVFTGSTTDSPALSPVVDDDPFVAQQEPSTPRRALEMPLTPVSAAPSVQADDDRGSSERASFTPHREGLRPRPTYVYSNGSPW